MLLSGIWSTQTVCRAVNSTGLQNWWRAVKQSVSQLLDRPATQLFVRSFIRRMREKEIRLAVGGVLFGSALSADRLTKNELRFLVSCTVRRLGNLCVRFLVLRLSSVCLCQCCVYCACWLVGSLRRRCRACALAGDGLSGAAVRRLMTFVSQLLEAGCQFVALSTRPVLLTAVDSWHSYYVEYRASTPFSLILRRTN